MTPVVVITGITGQDGAYLAEFLLAEGCRVIGAVRNVEEALGRLDSELTGRVELVHWDMLNQGTMTEILASCEPTALYNLAAHSSGAGMFDDPVSIGDINGLAVTRMLEAIRKVDPKIRFCQASSREIFGRASETPQTERTIHLPRSPYGSAKAYADSMVRIYRQHYGIFACSAILFNHESPRRGPGFVTRKITSGVARIKLGYADELHLGNLDTMRDWGFAGDYVRAMWLMLQQQHPDDYVVSSGITHSVREFCEIAFGYLDLDYRDYVRSDPNSYRPSEPTLLVGDATKARQMLRWEPQVDFRELVTMMVESDLHQLRASTETC